MQLRTAIALLLAASAIDTYVGLLNMNGQSGGIRATLGRYTSAELEPVLDPARWQPNHTWRPTEAADRFDELWAAMILMRLSPAHVAATTRCRPCSSTSRGAPTDRA